MVVQAKIDFRWNPPVILAQADEETGTAVPGESAGSGDSPTQGIESLSDEEIDRELKRIEAAVAGAETDELEEFTPSKPLAADLAIALPSDI